MILANRPSFVSVKNEPNGLGLWETSELFRASSIALMLLRARWAAAAAASPVWVPLMITFQHAMMDIIITEKMVTAITISMSVKPRRPMELGRFIGRFINDG